MKADPNTQARAKALRRQMTKAEIILWSKLKGKQLQGWHFRKQHPVGPFIADFACVRAKLIIEVDGATHSSDLEINYDQKRTAFLNDQGWFVYRIWNTDIYENLNGVLDGILAHLTPPQ
ncbi:MAG: DUF559 domain-containing protein [Pseudomonadota bacterium]